MHTARISSSEELGNPPACRPPCRQTLWMQTPLWTDRCKNITLPQTSFVGGKNWNCSQLTNQPNKQANSHTNTTV